MKRKASGGGLSILIAVGVAVWLAHSSGAPAPAASSVVSSSYYSAAQIGQLWEQAGGSPGVPEQDALCISAHEDPGGYVYATDYDSNGTVDRGLWQINSIWGGESTFDPLGNARAAVSISHDGTDWGPWSTRADCGL